MSATATDTEWVLDREPVTIQEWIDVMGDLPGEEPRRAAKDVDPYAAHRADLRKPRPGIRTRLQRIASDLHAATCVTAEVRCKEAYAALGEILDALDGPPFDDAPGVEAAQKDILAELTARLERDGASPTGCGARPDEDIEKLAREGGQP